MEESTEDNHLLLIDCGANLVSRKFAKDLETVISRAKDAGMILFDLSKFHYDIEFIRRCSKNYCSW